MCGSDLAGIRVFFATDIHGSESCFRKFVHAAKMYKCQIIIMGGDLTGKKIVPFVKQPDASYVLEWLGQHYNVNSGEDLERLKTGVRSVGSYPLEMTENEKAELVSDSSKFDTLFERIMQESVRSWIGYAEEKLRETDARCFIQPGNDDSSSIDAALSGSERIVNPEGKLIELGNGFEMISIGNSNPTPWNCPRDITEEELAARIEAMACKIRDPSCAIFNFHCPPYNSELDVAPQIDENLKVIIKRGEMQMAPVGSKAVRSAIETYNPLSGLHGHIHESRGVFKIGRTTCINPGSEYSEGILRGVIVNLEDKRLKSYQFTAG